jgi:hypothetical protein
VHKHLRFAKAVGRPDGLAAENLSREVGLGAFA